MQLKFEFSSWLHNREAEWSMEHAIKQRDIVIYGVFDLIKQLINNLSKNDVR